MTTLFCISTKESDVFFKNVTLFFSFFAVESTQKLSSSEILKLNEDLKNKEKKLESLENGDSGLNKVWSNLTEMNRKVGRFLHLEV